jgi:hypothetical protein
LFLDRLGPSFVREPAPRLQDRFLTELEHARPDYLLVYRVGWPRGGYDRLSWNERLNRFVSEQYEVADSEDDYRLMRRK